MWLLSLEAVLSTVIVFNACVAHKTLAVRCQNMSSFLILINSLYPTSLSTSFLCYLVYLISLS